MPIRPNPAYPPHPDRPDHLNGIAGPALCPKVQELSRFCGFAVSRVQPSSALPMSDEHRSESCAFFRRECLEGCGNSGEQGGRPVGRDNDGLHSIHCVHSVHCPKSESIKHHSATMFGSGRWASASRRATRVSGQSGQRRGMPVLGPG